MISPDDIYDCGLCARRLEWEQRLGRKPEDGECLECNNAPSDCWRPLGCILVWDEKREL